MPKKNYTFLFVNLPYSGHINPTITLAELLVEAGHEVTYVLDETFKETIEKTGAQFVPYDDYDGDWLETRKYMIAFERAYRTAERIGRDYDCLIYEAFFIFGYHLAESLSKPAVRLFSTFAFSHPLLEEIKETGGPQYKLLDSKNPFNYLLIQYFKGKKHMMSRDNFFDETVDNVADLNIVYTSRSFQVDSDRFSKEHYVFAGPSISDEPVEGTPDFDFNTLPKPVIYVAMGTMLPKFIKKIYQQCIDAFKDTNATLILSIGGSLDKSDFKHVSDNIHIHQKVDQVNVLKHADAFITHGGMNSVNESLHAGVPMLVHPFVNDQPLIADQLESKMAAQIIDLRKSSPDEIREALFSLIDSDAVKEAVQIEKEAMREVDGDEIALEKILEYMDTQYK